MSDAYIQGPAQERIARFWCWAHATKSCRHSVNLVQSKDQTHTAGAAYYLLSMWREDWVRITWGFFKLNKGVLLKVCFARKTSAILLSVV